MKVKEIPLKWTEAIWFSWLVNEISLFSVYRISISSTPHTPRLIKIFTMVACCMPINAFTQENTNIYPEMSMESIIKERYSYMADIEKEEFEEMKKYNYMNYVPSIGYSAITGINVNYNFSTILNFLKDRKINKAKMKQIEEKYKVAAQKEYSKYQYLLKKKRDLILEKESTEAIMVLEKRLYAIAIEKYNNLEIKPTEFLQKEIDFKKKELALKKLNMQLEDILFELSIFENPINTEYDNRNQLSHTRKK